MSTKYMGGASIRLALAALRERPEFPTETAEDLSEKVAVALGIDAFATERLIDGDGAFDATAWAATVAFFASHGVLLTENPGLSAVGVFDPDQCHRLLAEQTSDFLLTGATRAVRPGAWAVVISGLLTPADRVALTELREKGLLSHLRLCDLPLNAVDWSH